jgi:hypothetical protein
VRSACCFLLSLPVACAQGLKSWYGPRRLWPFLATRGFVGAASMVLYYEAIDRMPLADAVRMDMNSAYVGARFCAADSEAGCIPRCPLPSECFAFMQETRQGDISISEAYPLAHTNLH